MNYESQLRYLICNKLNYNMKKYMKKIYVIMLKLKRILNIT